MGEIQVRRRRRLDSLGRSYPAFFPSLLRVLFNFFHAQGTPYRFDRRLRTSESEPFSSFLGVTSAPYFFPTPSSVQLKGGAYLWLLRSALFPPSSRTMIFSVLLSSDRVATCLSGIVREY